MEPTRVPFQGVKNPYILFDDPGHAWLRVPMHTIKTLGIGPKISAFSYMSKNRYWAYLEEDCDMGLFIQTKYGPDINSRMLSDDGFIKIHRLENESKIRGFDHFNWAVFKSSDRNTNRREQNAVLRELCGTSARAAREDMGL
jgi:hypothetical protein